MSETDNKNGDLHSGADKKPEAKKTAKKRAPKGQGRVALWMREMRSELKKVVWPAPKQVLNNSTIVIVSVILIGGIIAVYDLLANRLLTAVIGLFQS
ncbi:MAG: preprotein translocase subunit SecE [Oscillospiraceae bacterium]|jgi:preprotein translocase subunit SecE|nr:preprotein translocase subunit SecE [Oscillospiraceae bacterium]